MENQYLSTSQLAQLLNISRIAAYKKIKTGKIKATRIGRNFIIDKKDLSQISGQILSDYQKAVIDKSVRKTVKEYGETLKLLGKG